MSGSPPPSSSPTPEVEYEEAAPANTSTRTVAIIKNHALQHRFDIEPRILEANFEVRGLLSFYRSNVKLMPINFSVQIVKERQMEFDTETDPETLYELFGEDADSLAECVLTPLEPFRVFLIQKQGPCLGIRLGTSPCC